MEHQRTDEREGFHWLDEEVVGGGLVDSFEGEHKVVLHLDGGPLKVEVEVEVEED